jgi:hypothetical protein
MIPCHRTRVDPCRVADHGPFPAGSLHAHGTGHDRLPRLRLLEVERDPPMPRLDDIERRAEPQRPVMQHGEVIGHALDFGEQVRREDDGATLVRNRSNDRFQDVAPHDRIQS